MHTYIKRRAYMHTYISYRAYISYIQLIEIIYIHIIHTYMHTYIHADHAYKHTHIHTIHIHTYTLTHSGQRFNTQCHRADSRCQAHDIFCMKTCVCLYECMYVCMKFWSYVYILIWVHMHSCMCHTWYLLHHDARVDCLHVFTFACRHSRILYIYIYIYIYILLVACLLHVMWMCTCASVCVYSRDV